MTGRRLGIVLGMVLVLAGVGMLVVAWDMSPASSELTPEVTYGVSPADGDPGIAIDWVVCPGVGARTVELTGHRGGSDPGAAVPVYWQVRSDAGPANHAQVNSYIVGTTPAGFYETVPYHQRLPNDLVSVSSPPGGVGARDGMSFTPIEVQLHPVGQILRGDYQWVSADRFAADGLAYCATLPHSPVAPLGMLLLGLGGVVLAGRRRLVIALFAAVALAAGVVALVLPVVGSMGLVNPRQPASAFAPGTFTVQGRKVLADVSPLTTRSSGAVYVARFLAPGNYSFAIGCAGESVQIGELSDIPNGVTGGTQLIGCNTPAPVNGLISGSSERASLVEIMVNPNGAADWHVVVLDGTGSTGPFLEEW
jgi:hypothetical protein